MVTTGNVNVTAQDIFNLQTVAIPANADLNNYTTPGLYYQNANANAKNGENYPAGNAGSLIVLRDAGCMQIYTEYAGANNKKPMQFMRGQYGGEWSAWSRFYDTANRPTPADIGALPTTGGTLNGNLTVKNTIQVGGVGNGVLNIGDNDSGLRSSADGQVDLWANNAKVGYWKSGTFSFTGQFVPSNYGNFDAKYQAKGSYTPAGQAYTKAESDGRYIQNIRLGAQVLSPSLALNYALGGGNVVTGFKTNGTWDMQAGDDHVYYRPIQYLHNGTWKTAASA